MKNEMSAISILKTVSRFYESHQEKVHEMKSGTCIKKDTNEKYHFNCGYKTRDSGVRAYVGITSQDGYKFRDDLFLPSSMLLFSITLHTGGGV